MFAHQAEHTDRDEIVVRGKWIFNGTGSVEEMADRLEEKAEWLREKDAEGYRLMDADEGSGYWTLRKPPKEERKKLDRHARRRALDEFIDDSTIRALAVEEERDTIVSTLAEAGVEPPD